MASSSKAIHFSRRGTGGSSLSSSSRRKGPLTDGEQKQGGKEWDAAELFEMLVDSSTGKDMSKGNRPAIPESKLGEKTMLMLDNPKKENSIAAGQKRRRHHVERKLRMMGARSRKAQRLFDIDPEQQKFALYEPLHAMWKGYMTDLLGPRGPSSPEAASQLLKGDLHGALITVRKSACPSYVGASGIVIAETQETFKIITRTNRLITIPKGHSTFEVALGTHVLLVYGRQFRFRASERSARKFKMKPTIDIV